jgi:ATP-dependent 26S proteasome regulatory subunit
MDEELAKKAIRMVQRAGVPMEKTYIEKFNKELGKTDASQRRKDAEERKRWEEEHRTTSETGVNVANGLGGKSALSRRMAGTSSSRPDLMMSSVLDPDNIATVYHDKTELQREMLNSGREALDKDGNESKEPESIDAASLKVSELVARAGAGSNFDGEALGIGGLNDVLSQVKRRIWIPLAAPPTLLKELGIHPVRGLLLYGKPGCGKTLLARTLGSILSPLRPITVVSGPEIMDKVSLHFKCLFCAPSLGLFSANWCSPILHKSWISLSARARR